MAPRKIKDFSTAFFSEKRWKGKYPEREDLEIWLILHGWKIRKINAEMDGKPLAELIHMDEKLIVAIDEKEKKMKVLNDVELDDF